MEKRSVFISYASEDYSKALELYHFLSNHGLCPWLDKMSLKAGQRWERIIQEELRRADFIVLLLSQTSINKRGYVQKEFRAAQNYVQEKLDDDVYLIPLKWIIAKFQADYLNSNGYN